MTTTILLARHGQSDWNAARRWQGFADRPLTDRGHEQAEALADRLDGVSLDGIYASDLERARETAAAVARRRRLEVVTVPELREVNVGTWEGLTREQAEAQFPEGFRRWNDGGTGWDDGESYPEMSRRVLAATRVIAERHPDGSVLIVSHGGPIRAIHAAALGLEIEAYRRVRPVEPNARLSAVCFDAGAFSELCAGDRIDELLARDQDESRRAAAKPPSPAG